MALLRNTAEGGTDAALVNTGGVASTGGASGDAFTAFTGTTTTTWTATGALDGLLSYRMAGSTGTNFFAWDDVAASADGAFAFDFQLASLPSSTHVFVAIRSLSSSLGLINLDTTGHIQTNAGTSGSFSTGAISAGVPYRCEGQFTGFGTASSSFSAQIYPQHSNTAVATCTITGGTTAAQAQRIRYIKPVDATTMTGVVLFDNVQQNIGSATPLGDFATNVSVNAGVASATGTAYDAAPVTGVFTLAQAEVALGTGTAYDVTKAANLSANAFAQTAEAVGEALFDSTGNSQSLGYLVDDAIYAVGTAYDATVKIKTSITEAAGTGTAYNATVQIDQSGQANSNVADATGTAYNAQVFVLGTGAALQADAIGTALDATVLIEIRSTQPIAPTAEAVGTAFDAVIDIDEHLPIYFTTPSVRERPYNRHPLWSRTYLSRGRTVLKFGSSYKQFDDPDESDVNAADKVYIGGRTYRIDKYEAAALTAAGYGAWISEVPEFSPIDI
jgi:hypothetical protein